jgi:hypothetical protein
MLLLSGPNEKGRIAVAHSYQEFIMIERITASSADKAPVLCSL